MRLEGIQNGKGSLMVRFLFRLLWRQGRVPAPLRLYAYRPRILQSFLRLVRTVEQPGILSPRLKGLAMHWTARVVQCRYWIDLTDRLARVAGLTPEELAELGNFRESGRFSELEKLVLEYAQGMTVTPVQVSEELFRALAAQLTPEQMVELTAAVALENFSARFNHAFGIEVTKLPGAKW